MQAVGIIPARWGSRRFPGKVVAPISGVAMIERVWRAARACRRLRDVIVATDDMRVVELCAEFGATAVMTAPDHPTGTDRVAEVAARVEGQVIVNVQGDEPLIEAFVIDAALDALEADSGAPMATVVHRAGRDALDDPNRVRVVLDDRNRAVDFSRGGTSIEPDASGCWQHVGLYAYRRAFLLDFVRLSRGAAERTHELEQLRALEHGHAIAVGRIDGWRSAPVDVPADVLEVERRLSGGVTRLAGASGLALSGMAD